LRVALPDLVTDYLVPVRTVGVPKGLKNKGVWFNLRRELRLEVKFGICQKEFVLGLVSDLDRRIIGNSLNLGGYWEGFPKRIWSV